MEKFKTIAVLCALFFAGLVGCSDQGKIVPTVPSMASGLSVGLDTVFSFPGDTVLLKITGGTPPFAFLGPPPSTAAQFFISGSTMTIVGNSVGSTVAMIIDASSPVNRLDLPISVESAVSFTNSIQPIFTGQYGCVGCHGGTEGLFLTTATVSYQNLVNVPAQSPGYAGYKRVDPRNLANSLLYIRLASNDPSVSMPQGRTAPFDPASLSNVRTWILQGAHFN